MNDEINDAIWSESPALQRSIQPPEVLTTPGAVGAQQAMADEHEVLPWVPDILGENWRQPDAVLIVGSAYAGFIREFSGRGATMSLSDYRTARTWQAFQEQFVAQVVRPDPSYYGPLTVLAGGTLQNVALLDLCRASFVKRGEGSILRRDNSGDRIVIDHPAIYSRYVDGQTEWTWQRILRSKARRIVALGTIAEHGLLRLFSARGLAIAEHGRAVSIKSHATHVWPRRYAVVGRTLGYWLDRQSWWTITGTADGELREWRLLPAFHPARSQSDHGYRRTAELLRQSLNS